MSASPQETAPRPALWWDEADLKDAIDGLPDGELRVIHDTFVPLVSRSDRNASMVVYRTGKALAERMAAAGEPADRAGFARWIELRNKSWRALRLADNPYWAARFARRVAIDLVDRGELSEARSILTECLEFAEEGDVIRPHVQSVLAGVMLDMDEWAAAIELIERALAEARAHEGWQAARSDLNALLGEVYVAMGLADRAIDPTRRAVELAEELVGTDRFNAGALFKAYHQHASLLYATEQYLRLEEFLEGLVGGMLRAPRFDFEELRRADDGTAFLDTKAGFLTRLVAAEISIVEEGKVQARPSWAYEQAVAIPSMRTIDRFTCELRMAYFALSEGNLEVARRHLRTIRTSVHHDEFPAIEHAFLTAMEARLDAALGAGPAVMDAHLSALDGHFEDMLAAWKAGPERAGGIGFLNQERTRLVLGDLLALKVSAVAGEPGIRDALRTLIHAQTVGVLYSALGAGEPDVEQLRATLLRPGAGILVYLDGKDRAQVFALDSHELRHAFLPSRRELQGDLRELLRWVGEPPWRGGEAPRRAGLEQASGRLVTALFPEPIRALVAGWSDVAIVGREGFDSLPFEMLPVLDGRPLGVTAAVSYLPSLPVAVALRTRERAAARRDAELDLCLVVGTLPASAPDGEGAPLPVSERSLARIRAQLGEGRTRLLRDETATLESVRATLPRARMVHFLTHGSHDLERERSGVLLLTPEGTGAGGVLRGAAVEGLAIPPVAFLAACRSGEGRERLGDAGASNLGGAFLRGGASAVLLSDSDLALRATERLSEVFYRELRAGAHVAEALRRARADLFASEAFTDPFYYALVHVVGLGDTRVYEAGPQGRGARSWMLATAALALAVACWRFRR